MHFSVLLQYLYPKHFMSKLAGRLARCRVVWLKNFLIGLFIRYYQIDLTDAVFSDVEQYVNFESFFIRQLKAGTRPIAKGESILASPVDGTLSQIGKITDARLVQAKGREFSLTELLADTAEAKQFINGEFATIYLSPRNYHRVHMPFAGVLTKMLYIPGRLFAVNPQTAESVTGLFARNERLILYFTTSFGPMVVVLVGALLVSGIAVSWLGQVNSKGSDKIQVWQYEDQEKTFARGDEIGFFTFGSTVILLFPEKSVQWQKEIAIAGQQILMGQTLGEAL
jgi:phosphatidylserine decarboxylase